ncbi:hypothetical protein FPL02_27585 [Bacillus paranthracis]|nr:hypothetical protein FPL02_27585 [Bacillus paranthracis]
MIFLVHHPVKCLFFSFLQRGWFLEIENEEMIMDDKQVDTIADRKRPIGEFLSIKSIYSNLNMFCVSIYTYCKII